MTSHEYEIKIINRDIVGLKEDLARVKRVAQFDVAYARRLINEIKIRLFRLEVDADRVVREHKQKYAIAGV